MSQGQRLRVAGWARALTPDRLSAEQRRMLEAFGPAGSSARELAEDQSGYRASPIWRLLDDGQRALVEDPSTHPGLAGHGYPLRTAQLALLVGASSDQIRYWNAAGLVPARRSAGNQRRFFAAAAMWAFLLAGMDQPKLTVLRQVDRGDAAGLLVAMAMIFRRLADRRPAGDRDLLLGAAANLQELGLAEGDSLAREREYEDLHEVQLAR